MIAFVKMWIKICVKMWIEMTAQEQLYSSHAWKMCREVSLTRNFSQLDWDKDALPAHDCARMRDCAQQAMASGYNHLSAGECLEHSDFLKLIRHTVSPSAVHMKPFSRLVRNTSVFQDRQTHVQRFRSDVVFPHAFSALYEFVRPHHSGIRFVSRENPCTSNSHVFHALSQERVFSVLSTRSAAQRFRSAACFSCDS